MDLVAAGFHQSQSNGLSSDFANGLCGYYLSKNNVVYYLNIGNLISYVYIYILYIYIYISLSVCIKEEKQLGSLN